MKPSPRIPAAVLGLLATATAQGPVALLTDVETTSPSNAGAFYEPEAGVAWGSYVYFAADADGHGNELWRSNGTVGNAERVADLRVGEGSDPKPIGGLGGWFLFVANDGISGPELWRTTGTPGGTSLVRDIVPGPAGSDPTNFVRYNNWYYFLSGEQLWKTDGTTGNTIAVSQTVIPGVYELVASGSQLWMVGGGFELWASDGGSSVYQVTTLPNEPSGLTGLAGINVVFECDDGINGSELWKSNGTAAGTQMLFDIRGGSEGSSPFGFAALANVAYFRAYDAGVFGQRLWRSNGTAAGTWTIDTPNGPRFPENITAAGNRLFFRAQDATNQNSELWTSDGTTIGTFQVADIRPGTSASGAYDFTYDGTQWTYFGAHDGSTGYELWRTDLTTTQRVSDIQVGPQDSSPTVLGIANGYCVFAALHGANDIELYASQGNGSHLVRDLRTGDNGSSSPERITAQVDGRFWFAGKRGSLGKEPYFSTGIPAGVTFLVDTVPGAGSGMDFNTRAASWGGYTFFNSIPGSVLWRTAGTVPSTNAIPGLVVSYNNMIEFAGKLFVDGYAAPYGEEVFVLASPLVAPTLLKDIYPGLVGTIQEMTVVGNRLFFVARDPQSGPSYGNLWITDGTTLGTQQVYNHGSGITEPQQLRALGRRVVFSYNLGFAPVLVVSDGTAPGTQTIGPLYATHERIVVGDRLFLAGEVPGSGTGVELVVFDGTTISLVKDIRPGSASSNLYSLTPFGNGVLFIADNGTNGFELWKSDGTTVGTQMVADVRPGAQSGCLSTGWNGVFYDSFVYAPYSAQRAVFLADDGSTGMELWRTDGTAAGTVLHADIQPGMLGSWPGKPVRCGSQLVFAATQTEFPAAAIGRELFAMPSMATAEPVGSSCANTLASAPLARGVGTPYLGNAGFALRVSGTPSTAALLVVGFPADQSQAPCELRFTSPLFSLLTFTDGQGVGQLGLGLPANPAFAGLRLGGQWGVLQNGGPYLGLAALSNGVDLVVQTQ